MYYAHIRWDDRGAAIASQTVAEHLSGTGRALTTQRRAQSPAPNTMAGSRTRPVSRDTTAACRILATCGPIALGTQRFMVG